MTRLQASILVLVLWAAIYLPGLGSTELKGEEGRRILPAVTMLETGNWLVPYVGGKPFLRKPPLVNWAIAVSFKLTGIQNEWTARLPSALCVLALGLIIVGTSGPGWMKPETAFVAALMAMTQFGLLAKARFAGAEIEGIYGPISGIAVVCWLAWWSRGKSPWLYWTVSGLFLGLASLAKGPSFHLIFFYAIVFTVLGRARRWKDALHPAHFVGLAVSVGLFAAWAVPYFKTPEAKEAAAVWKRQGIDRFTDSEFNAGNYFMNLPRGLMDQLPWLLLVPALWRKRQIEGTDSEQDVVPGEPHRPVLYATVAAFAVVLLIPGALPRYTLPLGAPFALVLAQALAGRERIWRNWNGVNRVLAGLVILGALAVPVAAAVPLEKGAAFDVFGAVKGALAATLACAVGAAILARRGQGLSLRWVGGASGALLGALMLLYGVGAVRWINRKDDIRPTAAAVNAAVPAGARLTIYDPSYLAAVFYLRKPYDYATELEAISPSSEWVLIRGKERKKFASKRPEFAVVRTIPSKGGEALLLLHREAELQKLPAR